MSDQEGTVTGRITGSSVPRIAIIDGGGSGAKLAMAALLASKFAALYDKSILVEADYSEIEERCISHYVQKGPDITMELEEQIYLKQLSEADLSVNLAKDSPYWEVRNKHQGRRNPRWGSRVAKDHRSATKRQRNARKKNRKK